MDKLSPPKDQDQRHLFRSDLSSSIIVEAGAGTGKTTLLIDRIVSLVGHFRISDVVAVTFTEKAAGELLDRLRRELERKLTDSSQDAGILRYLQALDYIDSANISTIHAFASSIIREYALELGIDPDYEHVEPEEEAQWLSEQILRELNRRPGDKNDWLVHFIALGGRIEDVYVLGDKLYKNRDLLGSTFERREDFKPEPVIRAVVEKITELAQFAAMHCVQKDDQGRIQINQISDGAPKDREENLFDSMRWMVEASKLNKNKGNQNNWDYKESCKEFKFNIAEFKLWIEAALSDMRRVVMTQLISWLASIIEFVDKSKIDSGRLGFQDQLIKAEEALNDSFIRTTLQKRFSRILIDEFQDTDPLQVEIAFKLAKLQSDSGNAFEGIIENGKLCIIGDPKQSIYRFRRADSSVYSKAANEVAKYGKKVLISQNFRSSRGVVEFVNAFFGKIWDENDNGKIEYIPIDFDPNRPDAGAVSAVKLLLPDKDWDSEKANAETVRSSEAAAIANTILELVENDEWRVFIPKSRNKFRKPSWNDIAILFPTTTGIDLYADALNSAGIPFRIEGGKRFFHRKLVRSIFYCLSAIDNPLDKLNAIACLRSDLFAVTDSQLLKWHETTNGEMDYRKTAAQCGVELNRALEILARLHKKRRTAGADWLLDEMIEATRIMSVINSQGNAWSDLSAIERLRRLARNYALKNGAGVRGFRRWLSDRIERGDDPGNAPMAGVSEGVRLITIHSAKGLEFPIVFLANLSAYSFKKSPVLVDRLRGGFEAGIGTDDCIFTTSGYETAVEEEEKENIAEKMRLLYVAMTRARDHLVIPMFHNTKDGVPAGLYTKWIAEFIEEKSLEAQTGNRLWRGIVDRPASKADLQSAKPEVVNFNPEEIRRRAEEVLKDRERRLEKAKDIIPERKSPSRHLAKPAEDFQETPDRMENEAVRIGRAFHRYMKHCPLSLEVDSRLAEYFSAEESLDADELKPLLKNCLNSKLWSEAINSRRIWREVPVMQRDAGSLISGVIDLVYENPDGKLIIVDYKTGSEKSRFHLGQIQSYASMVNKAAGKPVEKAVLFYAQTSRELPLPT